MSIKESWDPIQNRPPKYIEINNVTPIKNHEKHGHITYHFAENEILPHTFLKIGDSSLRKV